MPYSLYDASVPCFVNGLKSLAGVLAKGAAHAEARKIDPAVLLGLRLYPDMLPLLSQVQIATDSAKGATARLAGAEIPSVPDTETTFPELQARIAKTIAYLESFKPEPFAGAEDRTIVLVMGPNGEHKLEFVGRTYLATWVLPNFWFHVTTAYAILRHGGVEIGKREFLGL